VVVTNGTAEEWTEALRQQQKYTPVNTVFDRRYYDPVSKRMVRK
jgi:hypothetical protein